MAVDMPHPPPTVALPQLPISKLRSPSTTPETSRLASTAPTSSKLALRTPSKVLKPPTSLSASHAISSPSVPTLRTASAQQNQPAGGPTNKEVRRSVSIANFPQPPKVHRRTGVESKYSSAAYYSIPQKSQGTDSTEIRASKGSEPTESHAGSLRLKNLKTKTSTGALGQKYNTDTKHTLTDGNGYAKATGGVRPGTGGSNDLASLRSPTHSRSSSAQGSYSTSATTFDEGDEKRGRDKSINHKEAANKEKDFGKEGKGNVIVSVRVRPDAGGDKPSGKDWSVDGRQSLVSFRGREGGDYYYDNVFAPHDQNRKVYDASAKRLVRRVMEGYHGTVFAYGMTGTGKTFSMQGTATSPGVIPLAITDIFSFIRETPHREFLLRVSYLEIYNEKIHDLLKAPTETGTGPNSHQAEEIKLREDPKRGVFASPLKEEIVQSPTQLLRVIARGDQSRKTRSTQFNAQSSRSHAVVQIVVESRERPFQGKGQKDKRTPLVPGGVRVSSLSMIDLAGSERAAENKERRTEGAHINKSLLTLGTVIARLSGEKDSAGNPMDKEGKHLPYRDSKLTRLLQPALSGNSLVSILCTIQLGSQGSIATANGHIGETLNTLKFAARAKNNIVSHAKRAEEALGSGTDAGSRVLLERYRMEIQSLRSELQNQKNSSPHTESSLEMEERQFEEEAERRREEQMLEMQLARTALNDRIEHLNRLVLSSKSSGVNSTGKMSSLSMHPALSARHKSESSSKTLRSLRSSASHSMLGLAAPSLERTGSMDSTGTVAGQTKDLQQSPISSQDNDEELNGEFGDGTATSKAQIHALQADLADKNRYISTLEQRLLQARRSSHSRASLMLSPTSPKSFTFGPSEEESKNANLLKEKDAEIVELRARLEDKDRIVQALSAAARHRDIAGLASAPASPRFGSGSYHQSNDSKDSKVSGGSGSSVFNSHNVQSPVSPVQLLSPPTREKSPRKQEKERDLKRKSIDEMTKILDGMIQDRVQTGGLVISASGVVKPAHERSKQSPNTVPSVGALAAQLRPASTVSEAQ